MSAENQSPTSKRVAERNNRITNRLDKAIIVGTSLIALGGAAETAAGVYIKDLGTIAKGIIYTVGGGAATEIQRRSIKLNKDIQKME